MNNDLIQYYRDRAGEYESIYAKPERQPDLSEASKLLQDIFSNVNLVEIACGTGYWTEKIAETATHITATDINKEVITIAEKKEYPKNNVSLKVADIYTFDPGKRFDGLFGGFIWSHIKKQDLPLFLETITKLVVPGGIVVFMDNRYVEGSNHPITSTDEHGNTYQTRQLNDGSTHRVLKNFPDQKTLESVVKGFADKPRVINLHYFWLLIYQTPTRN
jgi:demethylmenaquinone methyltransferase/2-methoxy-6-polyprenyl-1,4-benzoquinol methylase